MQNHAPPYEPSVWNKGTSAEKICRIMQDFCRSTGGRDNFTGFDQLLELMSIFEKLKEGTAQQEKWHGDAARRCLSVDFNQAVSLYETLAPHLQGNLYRSNCYAYALNDSSRKPLRGRDDPGMRGGLAIDWLSLQQKGSESEFRQAVLDGCTADGLQYKGPKYAPPQGGYLVANFVGVNKVAGWRDSHFVRQDNDNGWSHKGGIVEVSRKDDTGCPIANPSRAVFSHYPMEYKFAGYYLVPAII